MKKYTQAMTQATPQTTPQARPLAIPQASSQQKQPHKHVTMKHTTMKHNKEDPAPYMYDTLQLSFLTTHYATTSNDYIEEFPLYTVPQYITRKKHPNHDNYLYRRWNKPTAHKHTTKTKKIRTKRLLVKHSTAKDDPSVTPTLETLCTTDTRTSNPTNIDTDAILSITIWKQPIVQYRMPIRPFPSTRNRSRHPSTAVQYALIGVYDKLLHSRKLPCLLYLFTSIICVVLSCFILLADFFAMVKIDDRYPDEWND